MHGNSQLPSLELLMNSRVKIGNTLQEIARSRYTSNHEHRDLQSEQWPAPAPPTQILRYILQQDVYSTRFRGDVINATPAWFHECR